MSMICPICEYKDSRVLDTRIQKQGEIKRRRECSKCKERFSTIETIITNLPAIHKKDGTKEIFSKGKLKKSILLACQKREVSTESIEKLTERVAEKSLKLRKKEITSANIGDILLSELKDFDEVAYLRFASVYNAFSGIDEFAESIKKNFKK